MPLPYMVFVGSFLCFSGWLFIPWSVKMMSTIRKQAPGLLGGLSCPPAARHRGCLQGRVETAGCAVPKKSPCTLFPPFFFFLCLTGEQPARGRPHHPGGAGGGTRGWDPPSHGVWCWDAGSGAGREKPSGVQGLPVNLRQAKLLLVTHASGVRRR